MKSRNLLLSQFFSNRADELAKTINHLNMRISFEETKEDEEALTEVKFLKTLRDLTKDTHSLNIKFSLHFKDLASKEALNY